MMSFSSFPNSGKLQPNEEAALEERARFEEVMIGNRAFVAEQNAKDPDWFRRTASAPQQPRYLFIGCSDSRVPANAITGLESGNLFVHRNIANLVVSTDINLLSVLQFSVEVLKVNHIIVCGHYGCGGVRAAMEKRDMGLMENWIRNIRDVQRLHKDELDQIKDEDKLYRRVVELNVEEQCINLFKTGIVQKSLRLRRMPWIHGLVYDLHDGLLRELEIDFRGYFEKYGELYTLDDN